MTIYNKETLRQLIDASDVNTLRFMLHKIILIQAGERTYDQIVRAVMQTAPRQLDTAVCYLSTKRVVPYREMKKLSNSSLMDYIVPIIEGALDDHGPFQSQDLLHKAVLYAGGKADFVRPDGSILHGDLVLAGYILAMAGFERKSVYIKELGRPAKCWKLTESPYLTIEERAQSVRGIVRVELARIEGRDIETPIAPQPIKTEDFY